VFGELPSETYRTYSEASRAVAPTGRPNTADLRSRAQRPADFGWRPHAGTARFALTTRFEPDRSHEGGSLEELLAARMLSDSDADIGDDEDAEDERMTTSPS
jgi:hypothetical protein